MPGPKRGLLVAAVLAALISCTAAIYEDQAGTFDWYKQFVGRPISVSHIPGRGRAIVATEQNLLASLDTHSGSVAWRRPYTEQDSLANVLVLQLPAKYQSSKGAQDVAQNLPPAIVLAASRGGKTLRAWDAADGGFRWEALVYEGPVVSPATRGSCGLTSLTLEGQKYPAVAVSAGNTIKLLGSSKGDVLWSATLDDAAADSSSKLLVAQDDVISLVAWTPGSSDCAVASYAAADGSSAEEMVQLMSAAPLGATAAVSGSSVAFVTEDGHQLCVLPSPGRGLELSCEGLDRLAPGLLASEGPLHLTAAAPGSFSLSSPAGAALISVGSDGSMQQVHWSADHVAAAPAASVDSSSNAGGAIMGLVTASADANSLQVKLLSAASGEEVAAADLAMPAPAHLTSGPAPTVTAAWLAASDDSKAACGSSKGAGLAGCQLLVLWSDDQLSFVEDGKVTWSREEALATVSSSLLVELPSAKAAAGGRDDEGSSSSGSSSKAGLLGLLQDKERVQRWMRLQVLGVLVQFKLNTDAEKEEFYQLRQTLSDNNLPYRDTNGFRKLIVVLTAPGKVFGLHSGDGRTLWASNTAAALPDSGTVDNRQYLKLWRRFHDLTHAPQVAVLSTGAQQSSVHVLNAHTGQQLKSTKLPYGVEKVITLQAPAHDGAAEQLSFFLIEPLTGLGSSTAVPRVHLLPDTPSVQAALSDSSSSTFFWLQQPQSDGPGATQDSGDDTDTVLLGFSLAPGAEGDAEGLLPVVPAWRTVLPGRLLAMASRDPTEPVHSYVKILGDRSLKYKYINPNLLFVATAPGSSTGFGSEDSSLAARKPTLEEQQVSVALINTVTGAVLHQQVHSAATGPVHAVVSEHWVVYSLRDAVSMRQQVVVVELYDASPRDLSIESIMVGRTQHAERLSSYSSMQLEVLSQSFYLQHSIKGMGVSQTLQGITTKQLLLHTMHDQVYALDKRYLDPRRPMTAKPTPQEAEEGLVPYSELIIFNTLAFPTQDKQVMHLRHVASAPAVLESTSLLFSFGTDLFFTRITPAAHFDSLQSDFSYGLLVVALLVLTVLTLVVRRSSEQTMLKAKWQ